MRTDAQGTLSALHRFGFGHGRHRFDRLPRHVAKAAFLSALVVRDAPEGKAAALGRYWMWQLRRRIHRRAVEVRFGGDYSLTIPHWSEIGGMIIAVGSHEPRETRFLNRLLRPGDLFVDVGANIGFYTHLGAAMGADVVAVEPGAEARTAMAGSLARAGLAARTRIVPTALGAEDGEAFLTAGDVQRRLTADTFGATRTDVRRLDRISDELGLSPADAAALTVLKIDAEGHDLDVLRGGTAFLSDRRPVVLVETWDGGDEVRRFLASLDYRTYFLSRDASLSPGPDAGVGPASLIGVAPGPVHAEVDRRLRERDAGPLRAPTIVSWR